MNDLFVIHKIKANVACSYACIFSVLNCSDTVNINNRAATFQLISWTTQLYFNHTTVISKSGSDSPQRNNNYLTSLISRGVSVKQWLYLLAKAVIYPMLENEILIWIRMKAREEETSPSVRWRTTRLQWIKPSGQSPRTRYLYILFKGNWLR